MVGTTIDDVQRIIRELYESDSAFGKLLLFGRPYICPFHTIIDAVPAEASILDIGCGSGLLLNLLSHKQKISRGIGFDAAVAPIEIARHAGRRAKGGATVTFEHLSVDADWPSGQFDVVSMIDVIHHVDPAEQRMAIERAASKVGPGGLFVFKDIGVRPRWRAMANRLHDLVLARQWIHYVPADTVIDWIAACGMELMRRERINMLWYGHDLLVFRRPAIERTAGSS